MTMTKTANLGKTIILSEGIALVQCNLELEKTHLFYGSEASELFHLK